MTDNIVTWGLIFASAILTLGFGILIDEVVRLRRRISRIERFIGNSIEGVAP